MSAYLLSVASETVDFVQNTGAGIKGLGGFDWFGTCALLFLPLFHFHLFGNALCRFFHHGGKLQTTIENGSRFNYLITLNWFSILLLMDLDAVKKVKKQI